MSDLSEEEEKRAKLKEYNKEYYIKNKLRLRDRGKKHYEENKEYYEDYYKENKEHCKQMSKQWREENKEYCKDLIKTWREENKEYVSERGKQYYEENKEHILGFSKQWREENKDHIRDYRIEYYDKHKDIISEKRKTINKQKMKFVSEVKILYQCANPECKWQGDFHSSCLDFHHISPKDKSFNIPLFGTYSIERIKEEMKKCCVVCAICHRLIHYHGLDCSNFKRVEFTDIVVDQNQILEDK